MRSQLSTFGVVYFLLVLNFYYQSNGFVKFYDDKYCLWKISPIVALALFTYFHGAGLDTRKRTVQALGIVFGGVGDWLIGASHHGIVAGAIFFGIGHMLYMSLFVPGAVKLSPSLAAGCVIWGIIANQLCLMPLIKEHPIAVAIMMVYSVVLTLSMLFSYTHYISGTKTHHAGHEGMWYRFLGFALFFASDNVLIFSHVGYPVPLSELVILGTYYSAQYLIVMGLVHCETDKKHVASPSVSRKSVKTH